jgi:hypothetical protein
VEVDHFVLVATSFKHLKSHLLSNIDCGNDVAAKSFSGTTCNWSLTSWQVSSTGLVITAKSSAIFPINLSFFFFRHYSLIPTLVEWLYSDFRSGFLAFHPVFKLQQDVTDDRSAAALFVSNFFQVAKHSIATLKMIVRTDLTTNRNGTLEVVEERDHVVLLENLKCFDQMLVAEVRWIASVSSPDFPGLSLAAANCKEFMQVVHEQTKNPKRW